MEKVNPDLIIRDDEGKPYTVRYEQVNAMLLNEFLKEHGKVEELQATVARQQKEMETVISRLKDQEAKIEKVSARLEVTTAAPRTVATSNIARHKPFSLATTSVRRDWFGRLSGLGFGALFQRGFA